MGTIFSKILPGGEKPLFECDNNTINSNCCERESTTSSQNSQDNNEIDVKNTEKS